MLQVVWRLRLADLLTEVWGRERMLCVYLCSYATSASLTSEGATGWPASFPEGSEKLNVRPEYEDRRATNLDMTLEKTKNHWQGTGPAESKPRVILTSVSSIDWRCSYVQL